ncbi:antiterminator LoaP [Clostridium estertheticum]|uniref:antiterminator LoaP n=1 Tax=Clostridium estertheticum TaxID=238834 RepID=UPI001CF46E81|nr:antiterminator LoaP [Clostridium estertheticum]MCB2360135.1 antiterminator LoaP [Clostridium estertheticum]
MKWYALFVTSGDEICTKEWLKILLDNNYHCIVPQRRLLEKKSKIYKEVIRTIFPGYVFIKIKMCPNNYYSLKKIPYLLKILNYDSYYTEIPEKQMTQILKLTSKNDIIDFSNISFTNSELTVISGPLKNNENMIKRIDKHKRRASIYLNIMGGEKKIDLGIKIIESPTIK